MRSVLVPTLFLVLAISLGMPCFAEAAGNYERPTVRSGADISVQYLNLARMYREQGRYELARQAYAQAISTCRNYGNLEIIKREMAGGLLLIRTMR